MAAARGLWDHAFEIHEVQVGKPLSEDELLRERQRRIHLLTKKEDSTRNGFFPAIGSCVAVTYCYQTSHRMLTSALCRPRAAGVGWRVGRRGSGAESTWTGLGEGGRVVESPHGARHGVAAGAGASAQGTGHGVELT